MNHTTNWSSSDAGGLCWVSDPHEAYLEAKVDEVGGGVVKATTSDGRPFNIDLKAPLAKPSRGKRAPKEPPRRILQREAVTRANGYNDMDEMRMLHEASILNNIELRFRLDLIYTNCGPILIAMNPVSQASPAARARRGARGQTAVCCPRSSSGCRCTARR